MIYLAHSHVSFLAQFFDSNFGFKGAAAQLSAGQVPCCARHFDSVAAAVAIGKDVSNVALPFLKGI